MKNIKPEKPFSYFLNRALICWVIGGIVGNLLDDNISLHNRLRGFLFWMPLFVVAAAFEYFSAYGAQLRRHRGQKK